MTDLTRFRPGITRVVVPGGIRGTVDMISTRLKRHPIWVLLDTGQLCNYAPDELTVLAVEAKQPQRMPYP